MADGAIARILARASKGAAAGWGPDNPLGLNPETWAAMQRAGVFRGQQGGGPVRAANEAVLGGIGGLADLAGKSAGAAYGAGAGLIAGAADEMGAPRSDALERDLMAMPEALVGGLGGLGGVAVKANVVPSYRAGERASRRFRVGQGGSINLGRVGPEVEAASEGRFPQAPIRMQEGISGPEGYGAAHISPDKHTRAQRLGYADGLELIEDVARNHDVVVEQVNGRLMLVKRDGQNRYAIAEYQDGGWKRLLGVGDSHYGITTGFPEYSRNMRPGKKNSITRALEAGGNMLWKKNP